MRVAARILLCVAAPAAALAAARPLRSQAAGGSSGDSPHVFAPGVVSTGHEFGVTFTSDMRAAFFTRNDRASGRNHIMVTERDGAGGWRTPRRLSFSSEEWSDLDSSLSPDGRRLYFISTRPHPVAGAEHGRRRSTSVPR